MIASGAHCNVSDSFAAGEMAGWREPRVDYEAVRVAGPSGLAGENQGKITATFAQRNRTEDLHASSKKERCGRHFSEATTHSLVLELTRHWRNSSDRPALWQSNRKGREPKFTSALTVLRQQKEAGPNRAAIRAGKYDSDQHLSAQSSVVSTEWSLCDRYPTCI